jgi:hypothetical protein
MGTLTATGNNTGIHYFNYIFKMGMQRCAPMNNQSEIPMKILVALLFALQLLPAFAGGMVQGREGICNLFFCTFPVTLTNGDLPKWR